MRPEFLKYRNNPTKTFISSDVTTANKQYEGKRESYSTNYGAKKVLAGAVNQFPTDVDISWLPAAAQTYDISPNIEDYVIVDVSAVTIDIPNRNLQAFPYEEVSYFDYAYGCMVYQTFIGKPSCDSHMNEVDQNTDLAKGVIFGSTLQYIKEYNIYKIRLLQGFCRQKDPVLANKILNGRRKYYSMGALVSNFVCPISGDIETAAKPIYPKGSTYNQHLSYSLCLGCVYIENSSVEEPADPFASGILL